MRVVAADEPVAGPKRWGEWFVCIRRNLKDVESWQQKRKKCQKLVLGNQPKQVSVVRFQSRFAVPRPTVQQQQDTKLQAGRAHALHEGPHVPHGTASIKKERGRVGEI